ncbi:hypothetical protein GCM10007860_32560 [Chitiniphilus shinanonensis]|uniref:Chlor_Arch_YYY domain-containing protein n=1 Tax=Chitiniphilus shinanonensis TaxID=553088 RepID=A0ABQ6BVS7_9NEIS|nr:DUF2298 domain-containing protein [Chitiniphilus shinanonensis]GLS06090.1 hypothetical protein GCM10007860_32560 [Chitiniphilus shinanonensis]
MSLIFTALTVLLLLVHLAALGQLGGERWSDRHLVRGALVFTLVLCCFFVEHLFGLGSLRWLWPFTLAGSLFVLRRKIADEAFWRGELPFLLPFAWAFVWRFLFPNLDVTAEHLTDLYFVRNYMDGATLPPPDQWLPGFRFDVYYALMHYAAALIGRLFHLSAGWSMNLGFCVLIGLLGSLVWSMASRWVASTGWRSLIVAATVAGGNGLAPLLLVLFKGPFVVGTAVTRLWANTRFTGVFDQNINVEWGRRLFGSVSPDLLQQPWGPRDLPLENIGYFIYLGDYHPPLAGFLLLFLALAIIARLETGAPPQNREDAHGEHNACGKLLLLLGASVPAAIALNSWVFPLQGLLVLGWAGWRLTQGKPAQFGWLIGGGLIGLALLYPFMSHFALTSLAVPLRPVPSIDHTPLAQWVAIWWPILWLMLLCWIRRFGEDTPSARLGAWAALGVLLLLVISETVYMDDPSGDRYNRFNTVLKWWSWLFPGALALLATLLISAERRAWRWLAAVPLIGVLCYTLPQLQYLVQQPKPHAGKLGGEAWLTSDPVNRRILEYLRVAPRGLVVEGIDGGAYMATSAFALHAAQPAFNGWPSHVAQWHGEPQHILIDAETVRRIYRGELPNAAEWLMARGARYVVWSRFEQNRNQGAFAQLQQQLAPSYVWRPLSDADGVAYGVWERR